MSFVKPKWESHLGFTYRRDDKPGDEARSEARMGILCVEVVETLGGWKRSRIRAEFVSQWDCPNPRVKLYLAVASNRVLDKNTARL
mmetsp:Transcript_8711/g.21705  ORF Transcript_8711/g.21705 Transcript_8711/m.21705 type:complete len:86 (-) Transcript_8711:330-587(-)